MLLRKNTCAARSFCRYLLLAPAQEVGLLQRAAVKAEAEVTDDEDAKIGGAKKPKRKKCRAAFTRSSADDLSEDAHKERKRLDVPLSSFG